MPIFAVLLEDDPERADVRQQSMPEHLAFLDRNAAQVRFAGPLRDAVEGTPGGGLWVVEAADADQVARLLREDPFWAAGLRRSVRVLEWRQVFADGRRT